MHAYWRAANYLSVGQIYLYANPLLREPLTIEHIKPRLLGHWGTTPGLNFIYVHFNRLIRKLDLDVIYIAGPGHGGPGLVANTYLEGSYTEFYPNITQNEEGMQRLFKQFSFPGGIPSHAVPETPGSIHEGERTSVTRSCTPMVLRSSTIPICWFAASSVTVKLKRGPWRQAGTPIALNPARDGAVLPILHLNGYKIANPTVLGRMTDTELVQLFTGYGYRPYFVEGYDPDIMHPLMAATLDTIVAEIHSIQHKARVQQNVDRPLWPMIILRTPKGWTGPKVVDGKPIESTL